MGRPLRGSRLASFYSSESDTYSTIPALSAFDSAFQLQEYIGALVRHNPHDVERIVQVPGRNGGGNGDDKEEGEGEEERVPVDEPCWIYEQLRRLAQDLTHPLITTLQTECTRQTCPEMKAGEWLYLCVAHGNSGAMEHCCAIDYIVHTLDSATALLNSPRAFPSRISIPSASHRHFPSIARRLGRIFAHAYYHHRLAFESAEAENSLYARFLALSRRFDLVPAEFLVIPAERNTQSGEDVGRQLGDADPKSVTVLMRGHEDVAAPPQLSTTSPPPRTGGRPRTDTMYLSGGGYVSPRNRESPSASPRPSPRQMPSPLAVTSTASTPDVNPEQELPITQQVTVDLDMPVVENNILRQDPEIETKEQTSPPQVPTKVIVRDFALEVPVPTAVGQASDNSIEDHDTQSQDVPLTPDPSDSSETAQTIPRATSFADDHISAESEPVNHNSSSDTSEPVEYPPILVEATDMADTPLGASRTTRVDDVVDIATDMTDASLGAPQAARVDEAADVVKPALSQENPEDASTATTDANEEVAEVVEVENAGIGKSETSLPTENDPQQEYEKDAKQVSEMDENPEATEQA